MRRASRHLAAVVAALAWSGCELGYAPTAVDVVLERDASEGPFVDAAGHRVVLDELELVTAEARLVPCDESDPRALPGAAGAASWLIGVAHAHGLTGSDTISSPVAESLLSPGRSWWTTLWPPAVCSCAVRVSFRAADAPARATSVAPRSGDRPTLVVSGRFEETGAVLADSTDASAEVRLPLDPPLCPEPGNQRWAVVIERSAERAVAESDLAGDEPARQLVAALRRSVSVRVERGSDR